MTGKSTKRFSYLVRLALGCLGLAAVASCGKQGPADELERIRQAKNLYVAVQPVNDPFAISSGPQIIGFDADLGEAIARKIGVPVKWIPKPFEELFDSLAESRVNLIISVVTITAPRREKFAFSESYFQAGQIFAIRKDSAKTIMTVADLKGKKVGVHGQTTAHIFAQNDPRLQGAEIVPCPSIDSALLNLDTREVDAVVAGFPVLVQSVGKSFPNLTVVGKPLSNEQKGVVLRKGEDKLLQVVNETIRELKSQGKLEEMGRKWFQDYDRIKELQSQVPGEPLG